MSSKPKACLRWRARISRSSRWELSVSTAASPTNSIEGNDDKNLDGFVGVDKSLNEELTVLLEYDLGTNDDGTLSVGRDRGYLNGAVHWTIANKLGIDILLKDLLNNRRDASSPSREIRITYTETL